MKLTANQVLFPLSPQQADKGNWPQLLRIMKLTTILILVACLHTSANGIAQQTITFSGKEVSLENVFNAIKKQTNYRFFFNTDMLQHASKITIDVKNAQVEQVMNIALKDQPLTFAIKGRTIFIMKKPEEEKKSVQVAPPTGDPITVSGKVTDDKGQPLVGANVKVKGAQAGTTTDHQGRFTLSNVDGNATLEISFVGYDPQLISIKGKNLFTIALGQKQSILDETVVIAYGTSSRRFTTGNIATVKSSDIEKAPVQNPLLALQGRIPGIEITQLTGLNGGGVTVQIQGRNSIRSGLNPLIVVDGVPYPSQLTGNSDLESILLKGGSPMNYINPADIESIDILKDADATAIYGSRAANGAILITTKKGKAGSTRVTLNLQQGWGKTGRKLEMLNTRQYLDMRYEAFRNDGIIWTQPSVVANDLKVWDTTRYTDWQKELTGNTAKYTDINIGFSGGSTTMQYLLSATYNRLSTVFPGDFDDKKGGMHFNVNGVTPNQRFKAQFSGSYMYDNNRLPNVDLTAASVLLEPNAPPLYKEDGTLNWAPNAAGASTWENPLSYTTSREFNNITKNLVSNLGLSYRIVKGLDLRTSIGYNTLQSELYRATRLESFRPETRPNAQRSAVFGNRNMSTWIIEPNLQYTAKIGKGRIDALLGTTIQQSKASYLSISGSGFYADELMKTLTAAKTTSIRLSSSSINRYNALFGRLNYIWRDKYIVNLTARRDGSNRFGDKNKFNNFGSFGVGWIFSEEKFMHRSIPFFDYGKLRVSYGVTGNDQIPDFSYVSIYQIVNPTILFQNNIGLDPINIPNPYLKWERTRKLQAGIDIGIMSDRILAGITFARNRSSNQLIGYVLPSLAGFTSITKNFPATVQNTSWEFTLNTVNIKSKAFSWSSSGNLTIPRNKLVSFPGIELTSYASGADGIIVGKPLGVTPVFHYSGINPISGRYLLTDMYGNPSINGSVRDRYISTLTVYYGGITNSFSYKKLQLDFLIQFVRKRGPRDLYWYNGNNFPGQFVAGNSNQPVSVLDRWQKPGDNALVTAYSTSTYSPTIATTDAFFSLDASYVRLKNLSLSWLMPQSLLKRAHLQNARIYFRGQNLFTITKYTGLDPESGGLSLPPLQIWTAGVNLEL